MVKIYPQPHLCELVPDVLSNFLYALTETVEPTKTNLVYFKFALQARKISLLVEIFLFYSIILLIRIEM